MSAVRDLTGIYFQRRTKLEKGKGKREKGNILKRGKKGLKHLFLHSESWKMRENFSKISQRTNEIWKSE